MPEILTEPEDDPRSDREKALDEEDGQPDDSAISDEQWDEFLASLDKLK
jgi:hypothetical protein